MPHTIKQFRDICNRDYSLRTLDYTNKWMATRYGLYSPEPTAHALPE